MTRIPENRTAGAVPKPPSSQTDDDPGADAPEGGCIVQWTSGQRGLVTLNLTSWFEMNWIHPQRREAELAWLWVAGWRFMTQPDRSAFLTDRIELQRQCAEIYPGLLDQLIIDHQHPCIRW